MVDFQGHLEDLTTPKVKTQESTLADSAKQFELYFEAVLEHCALRVGVVSYVGIVV